MGKNSHSNVIQDFGIDIIEVLYIIVHLDKILHTCNISHFKILIWPYIRLTCKIIQELGRVFFSSCCNSPVSSSL